MAVSGTSDTASKIAHAMKRHKKAVLSPYQKLLLLVAGMIALCVALYALSVLRPGEKRDTGQSPYVFASEPPHSDTSASSQRLSACARRYALLPG